MTWLPPETSVGSERKHEKEKKETQTGGTTGHLGFRERKRARKRGKDLQRDLRRPFQLTKGAPRVSGPVSRAMGHGDIA